MATEFYQYKNFNFNDFDLVVKDGVLYAVYVKKFSYPKNNKGAKRPNRFSLAKSGDGKNWEEVGDILFPRKNTWEESLWAGAILKECNYYTLYYTGVTKLKEASTKVGKAYSKDLIHWKKDPGNPVLVFDSKNPYYSDEPLFCFRDPYPIIINNKKYVLVATKDKSKSDCKRGCIGIVRRVRKNKFNWMPPIFSPGKYPVLECPALYKIKNRWYLFYGDDKKAVFRYAVANEPFGPFREPKNNILLPKLNYNVKIVRFKGRILLYHWYRDFPGGFVRERLAYPKEIKMLKGGEIRLKTNLKIR